MARRLYLHIGTMKSGTTYLQGLFEENRDYLLANGLLWPDGELRYRAVRELLAERSPRGGRSSWHAVATQIAEHEGDAIFSNELLAVLAVDDIRRLVEALPAEEIRVVITARNLVRVVPSHWQSKIKDGRTETWKEFASAVCSDEPAPPLMRGTAAADGAAPAETLSSWFWRRHDVAAIIRRWSEVVPVEQTTLVTVSLAGHDPDLFVRRFGAVVGVDLTNLTQPETSNPSLGAHSAELLRRLNEDIAAGERAGRVYGRKMALPAALIERAADEPEYALDPAQQEWVAGRAARMVQEIVATRVQVEGDLRDLTDAPEPVQDGVDPADATDTELLRAASHGLIAMVCKQGELRDNYTELEDQVRRMKARQARAARRTDLHRQHQPALVGQPDTAVRVVQAPRSVAQRVMSRLARIAILRSAARRLRRPN